jgi:Cysteine rich repeat
MLHLPNSSPRIRTLAAALVAIAATAPSIAGAQTISTEMRNEALSLMLVCHGDYCKLCSDVQPGGGRVLACLQSHGNQLTAACAGAMPRAEALKNSAINSGVMPK